MQTLTYNQLDEQRGVSSATVTAPADGVSDWVLGPCGAYPLTVAVHPGAGGTAVCRITTSRIEEIVAGTALWQPWGLGTVAADTIDALQSPVVALHLAATGAAATMDIVAGN